MEGFRTPDINSKQGTNTSKEIDSSFKPKLLENVEIIFFKKDERGEFYLLRNPKNLKYLMLNSAGYVAIQMFDGNTPLSKIERRLSEENIEVNLRDFVKFLAERGFVENLDIGEDLESVSIDVLSTIKYPLVKASSAFAVKIYRIYSYLNSRIFLIFYVLFCGAGLLFFFTNLSIIIEDGFSILSPNTPLAPLLIAFLVFYAIDFMHEIAHAAVFYNLGGIPSNIGFTFHYLVPFFYTDVPDVRSFNIKKSLRVFLAGPLSTLFFGSLSVMLYFYEFQWKTAWAMLAFGCYISTLFTLIPFIKTDGYYIIETLLKFPNFHTHALKNIKNSLKYAVGLLSSEDYKRFRSVYSKFERKALDVYCLFLPFGMFGVIYISSIVVLEKAFPKVLTGISLLLSSPQTATPKAYANLLIVLFFVLQALYGISATCWRIFKWKVRRNKIKVPKHPH